jgi:hypothetical protein
MIHQTNNAKARIPSRVAPTIQGKATVAAMPGPGLNEIAGPRDVTVTDVGRSSVNLAKYSSFRPLMSVVSSGELVQSNGIRSPLSVRTKADSHEANEAGLADSSHSPERNCAETDCKAGTS